MMVLRSSTDYRAGGTDNGTVGGSGDGTVGVTGNSTVGVTGYATVGGSGDNDMRYCPNGCSGDHGDGGNDIGCEWRFWCQGRHLVDDDSTLLMTMAPC